MCLVKTAQISFLLCVLRLDLQSSVLLAVSLPLCGGRCGAGRDQEWMLPQKERERGLGKPDTALQISK